METSDLLKRVRQIEIKTRGLSSNIFAGEYHTAFKGRGMTFSEVRAYQYGDDIRSIDWNVTARYNHPYVKIFEEVAFTHFQPAQPTTVGKRATLWAQDAFRVFRTGKRHGVSIS